MFGSLHLRDTSNDAVNIGLPSLHSHDGKNGIHTVVLLAVNGLYIEPVNFENAKDVAILDHALRNAIAVVPHVVRLFVEREPVECAKIHDVVVTL